MGFKNMKTNLTFADVSLFNSMEKNRAIKRMEEINRVVDWPKIESLLLSQFRNIFGQVTETQLRQ